MINIGSISSNNLCASWSNYIANWYKLVFLSGTRKFNWAVCHIYLVHKAVTNIYSGM